MKAEHDTKLAAMLRTLRVAGLATLHDGAPQVSMVAFVVADDFQAFYIHVSGLARHTRDMMADSRVSLIIIETDDGRPDPGTLARISILGEASPVAPEDTDFEQAKNRYLKRFPESAMLFRFRDFGLWRITPKSARFVAGFAQAFNLTPDALKRVSQS
ncbi:MAG: hypothetical protein Kow002_15890 [Anaerolineales bacterium]